MDYARTYWLLYLGIGLLFGVQGVLDYLATDALTLQVGVSLLVTVVLVVASAHALRRPDRAGGPEEPNLLFAVAVIAFLALVVLTAFRLHGL